ncbi:MAG: flagellar basal body M-ring protein FliF [Spirochaetaceae bacterium]|nr:MAG: flagellar basal body M-ring protein FliF [Spirochaetaceae bacterium]
MNELFQRVVSQLQAVWGKWTIVQKGIFIGVIVVAIAGMIALGSLSGSSPWVPLFSQPITDQADLERIRARLDQENVESSVSADGVLMVADNATARRMRAILTREDLIPSGTDPWQLFDIDRWTQTDFERNVNLRRAITRQLQDHILSLDEIDAVSVILEIPEQELFTEDQKAITASIIITAKPGSDIAEDRKKIEGIEKLVQFAVAGLKPENITITDRTGRVLNDFANLAEFDRLELTRRELEIIRSRERQYRTEIQRALSAIYTPSRFVVTNINVDMDMGKRTEKTEEFFPIEIKPDNPRTPFDDSEVTMSVTRSVRTFDENYEGSGFNPEGPPGQEGQMPPGYKDMEGLVGTYNRNEQQVNNEINRREIYEEKSPEVRRISVSVALDGTWTRVFDDRGNLQIENNQVVREYTPVPADELARAKELIEAAVGFNRDRGDTVTVQHIQFDRTQQFIEEDAQFLRRQQVQQMVLYILIGVAILLVSFIVFRLVSREIERRRRLREEELARQHQAMREAALRSAEEEGTEVEMSVEERARMELQENAVNMAREHPEDVAQLIRTWLREE